MGIKLTKERINAIKIAAVEAWIERAERRTWRCLDLNIPISDSVKLSNQSTELVKIYSAKVLGKERAKQLSRPQKERLRDEVEFHGRNIMEAFLIMREPWVVALARLLKEHKLGKK